jgi:branched-chain amino acid aminotransferase group I
VSELVFLNGSFVTKDKARVSILDYGFLFGYGIFETMRTYKGKVFCLEMHLERLQAAASGIEINVEKEYLKKVIYDTIRVNNLTESRVRLIVTPGEGTLSPDIKTCSTPTIIVFAVPYHPYSQDVYDRGWRVIISKIRRNSQSPLPGMKSSNFLESMLVKQEARQAGVEDALMLNDKGLLAEASSSNVFIISNRILQTPCPGGGLLPGITRRLVLELAVELGIQSAECDITSEELLNASEVFLTNSMIEIMPVVKINDEIIGNGRPGLVTKALMHAYRKRVRAETA